MEIISKIAELITSLISDPKNPDALKSFLEILIFLIILSIAFFFRQIIVLIPLIRDIFIEGEKYAGQYVQIINSNGVRRYSLLDIKYLRTLRGYFLRGIQYDIEGHRAIDFDSENMAFRKGPISYMEFVWRAETVSDKKRFDGYTQMRPDDTSNFDMLEGRGFFITFDQPPRRFDMRFIKLTKTRLKIFNLEKPRTEKDRIQFIKDLHTKLVEHPHLQPLEESGVPLL